MFEPHTNIYLPTTPPLRFSPPSRAFNASRLALEQFKLLDDANPLDLDILCDAQQVPPDLTDLDMPHDLLFGDPSWAL